MLRALSLTLLASALWSVDGLSAEQSNCPAPPAGVEDSWDGEQAWRALQHAGFRFGAVIYRIDDVYGSDAKDPDAAYARAMNFLHIESRPGAIRPHLLFEEGAPVEAELVHQSERRLRALKMIKDARISPVNCAGGVVDLEVHTQDTWTLKFGFDFSSVGGQTSSGLFLHDQNFLGTGKSVFVRKKSDALRDSKEIGYGDPALFGSLWDLYAQHESLSDGQSNWVRLRRPFATQDSPWAVYIESRDVQQTLSFHEAGEVAWRTTTVFEDQEYGLWRLLDWDGDEGWRAGIAWRESRHDYGPLDPVNPGLRPPPVLGDRDRRGVVLSLTRFHDHWHTFRDLRTIGRTEDINLGLDGTLAIGHFPEDFATSPASWTGELTADWAGRLGDSSLLVMSLDAGVRRERGGNSRDGRLDLSAAFYGDAAPGRTHFVRLALGMRHDPDPENELYLGGSSGMLGYPGGFLAANRAWSLHVAERWVTSHDWFQTFRVGWNAFVEVGSGRRIDGTGWSPLLMDIGGGLRLGNLRGTDTEPIFLSVAFPVRHLPGTASYELVLGIVQGF